MHGPTVIRLGFEISSQIIYPTLRESSQLSQSRPFRDPKAGGFQLGPGGLSQGDASMVRHLTTLVLGGILGSMVLVGNAEACHKNKCNGGCRTTVVCAAPVPAPCVQPVAYCKPVRCASRWWRSRAHPGSDCAASSACRSSATGSAPRRPPSATPWQPPSPIPPPRLPLSTECRFSPLPSESRDGILAQAGVTSKTCEAVRSGEEGLGVAPDRNVSAVIGGESPRGARTR